MSTPEITNPAYIGPANERNFATFVAGDNPYHLAHATVTHVAEAIKLPLGDTPDADDVQAVMDVVGKEKELRTNPDLQHIERPELVAHLNRAGTQLAIRRSLATPDIIPTADNTDRLIISSAVANWFDRAVEATPDDLLALPIDVIGGSRVMELPTEVTNPNIKRYFEEHGRYPTEAEYAVYQIKPRLEERGAAVALHEYESRDLDQMLKRYFEENPEAAKQALAIVKNANTGIIASLQVRNAAQSVNAKFDTNPSKPQISAITDGFEVAATDAQEADSANFQKKDPAARQLFVVTKKLIEHNQRLQEEQRQN